ncbi:hypothetical protein AN958_09412 [Leucoagaricus sp. SymC.cos]|nr:hypothetical protein AN958_09412 [Leucoagaricus sp. SymC.cos]
MSLSHTPTLPWVLPMFVHMQRHLSRYSERLGTVTTTLTIHEAAAAGLTKLQGYFEKTKSCQFNVIATLLHPHLGITWFRKALPDEVEKCKILFEYVFTVYEA